MFKLFKKDKETTKEEEWISILKKDGINLTKGEIQKARQNDGKTLFNIGYGYLDSKKDDAKAFAWFYKAALENYDKAQYNIGFMYKKGQGVSQDYKLAMEWYQKATSNGNSNAQFYIGIMYYKGQGVSQDYKLAMEIFQKAASNGDSNAQFNIGYIYDKGQGVPQDYKLAMDWYQKAVSNGSTDAQNNIGCLYKFGRGVSQDYKLAIEWYQKAADNNHEKAKRSLKKLKEQRNVAKEDHKGKEGANIRNTNTTNVVENEQTQTWSSTSNNNEHFDKLIDDKIKSIQDQFQLKFDLMENANKTALSHLQQEQTQKDEENKQLKEKLAKLEAELNRVTDNDLNYDSPDDENDNDDNNNINYDTECSDEEQDTKHSTRKYVSIEEYADPNYGSLDDDDYNDNGDNNTTDYYTECSDEEEEEEGANYDSSDNEDRTNDIYLD